MKKLFGTAMVMLFLFVNASTASAVKYPEYQKRMVNDFAGILDTTTKDRIEKKLRNFEKQTTNEVVVAIVPDLQGEDVDRYAVDLFKKWGIGKKGKNNGVLLLVSMKEHKWRFEVGYGLEGILPDGRCGQIARENMVPHFKKGNFGQGIEEGLSVAMNIIASPSPKALSPEEIKRRGEEAKAALAAMRIKKEQEKQREEKIGNVIVIALGTVVAIVIIAFLGYLLFQGVKKARAQRKLIDKKKNILQSLLKKSGEYLGELSERMKKVELSDGLPVWIKHEYDKLVVEVKRFLKEVEKRLASIRVTNDIESLSDNIEGTRKVLEILSNEDAILKEIESFPDRVVQMRKEAKEEVSGLERKIADVLKLADKITKDGYKISKDVGEKIEKAQFFLDELKVKIRNDNDPKVIVSKAKDEATKLAKVEGNLHGLVSLRSEVEKKTGSIPKIIEQLLEEMVAIVRVLDDLKKNHAEKIWKKFAAEFASVERSLNVAKELVASAEEKGSMKNQNFSEAAVGIRGAEDIMNSIQKLFANIQSKHDEAEKAKTKYVVEFSRAEDALSKAAEKIQHPDVDDQRKRNVEKIKHNLLSAKKIADSGGIIDWIAILAVLSGVVAMSSEIMELSQNDISQAGTARIAAETGRRRHQQEEEENNHRRNSHSSSSDSGSSSGSSDSGISFGGGGSGGGGASGSW